MLTKLTWFKKITDNEMFGSTCLLPCKNNHVSLKCCHNMLVCKEISQLLDNNNNIKLKINIIYSVYAHYNIQILILSTHFTLVIKSKYMILVDMPD